MESALNEAEATLRRADMCSDQMARLLKGRLRKVRGYGLLKELKAELKDYNAHTGQWKETK